MSRLDPGNPHTEENKVNATETTPPAPDEQMSEFTGEAIAEAEAKQAAAAAAATVEAQPVTIEEAIDSVRDGSRLAEGEAISKWHGLFARAGALVGDVVRTSTAAFRMAAETHSEVRAVILMPDGRRDWAGQTEAYQAFVKVSYAQAFGTLDDGQRTTATNNVRNHVRLTYLERAIRRYVAGSLMLDGSPMFPASAEVEEALAGDENRDALLEARIEVHAGTEQFNLAIRREYRSTTDASGKQLIQTPVKYRTVEDKANEANRTGSGPGQQGGRKTLDEVLSSVDDLAGIVLPAQTKATLKAVSLWVRNLKENAGDIENRPGVKEDAERIDGLAGYALMLLDGVALPKHHEQASEWLWGDSDKLTPPVATDDAEAVEADAVAVEAEAVEAEATA